jgi:predicted glycosyltransferase
MPDDAYERLRAAAAGAPELELVRSVPNLGAELAAAAVTVSQGGYNTTLEVVRADVPALIVPYATPEEDEQVRRARRLEGLGAVRVLAPERLEPAVLAREIEALRAFEPTRPAIDLDGGRGTCQELWELIRGDLRPALLATVTSP